MSLRVAGWYSVEAGGDRAAPGGSLSRGRRRLSWS